MEHLNILIVLSPILGFIGYILRRAFVKIEKTMSEPEIRVLIQDKLDPVNRDIRNIEKELSRIDGKLDQILKVILNEKHGKQ